jgi:transposase InsO family protein
MDQRAEFIKEMLKEERPFKHLCQAYGISENTGYKWKERFIQEGMKGLSDRGRTPLHSPTGLPEKTLLEIIRLKNQYPCWGPKKIRVLYQREHGQRDLPSESSFKRVLDKAGMTKKQRVRSTVPVSPSALRQYIQAKEINDVWALDFKGWWRSSGELCEPFTVRDMESRFMLEARLMRSKGTAAVKAVMQETFREYGLPKVIRSDNGTPFCATNGTLTLTKLSAWWMSLGILPDRIDPGSPGQNGSLERVHADIAREVEGRVSGGVDANQEALNIWREAYNHVRPNEALGMRTPAEVYRPSPRKYTGDFDELDYPPGYHPRKVFGTGVFSYRNTRIMLSTALSGYVVGLRETQSELLEIFLGEFMLGLVDPRAACFIPLEKL